MSSENINNSSRITAAVAILLLIVGGIYLTIEMGVRSRAEKSLDEEKLKSEALLSEKLSLEKDIHNLKSDIANLTSKNDDLNNMLKSTNNNLKEREQELVESRKQNLSIPQLKKQRLQLMRIKEELEQKITNYEDAVKQLHDRNIELESELVLQEAQNKMLISEITNLRKKVIEDVLLQTQKRNSKLTVKAKRTKKLILELDVPSEVSITDFEIIDPQGKRIIVRENEMSINVVKDDFQKLATPNTLLSFKRIQMVYIPAKKLKAGIYRVTINDKTSVIGSMQVKLI